MKNNFFKRSSLSLKVNGVYIIFITTTIEIMVKVKRFTAKWCGPCHQLAPVFEQMATEFPNVRFETIDVDISPDSVQEYMVTSVPTVVIEHEGQAVQRYVGLNSKITYSNFIKSLI